MVPALQLSADYRKALAVTQPAASQPAAATPSPKVEDRHPATQQIMRHFGFGHLHPELAAVSREFHDFAHRLLTLCHDGPEFTVALRRILEAKDAAVRSAVEQLTGK